jgi:hypothetical protein
MAKEGDMSAFSQGEVIVRDDLKFPDGALVVDGLDDHGCLLVHPLGGGFQLVLPPEDIIRFQRVDEAETIAVFNAGTFCIDGVDQGFHGWSDGSFWNGWEKPCFTRPVAEQILEAVGWRWSYDASSDEFAVTLPDSNERECFAGETIHLGDGGSVTAYFVGAGSWMWDKI